MDEKRQKKFFLMKIAVTILAILILALWAFNLKNVWRADQKLAAKDDNAQWLDLKTSLDKTLTDLKSQLNDQKTRDTAEKVINQTILNDILEETGKRVSAIASSTATTTATTTATNTEATATPAVKAPPKNCPEYIDCMPTIGASRPCQIPAGCEGITQIAY